ncbi:MAG: hypothetical protein OEX08_01565 [Candidatus Nomurabacteria bacterium]|nr:hypothetical protein [Candidatus Nomurabacteria bacterium]
MKISLFSKNKKNKKLSKSSDFFKFSHWYLLLLGFGIAMFVMVFANSYLFLQIKNENIFSDQSTNPSTVVILKSKELQETSLKFDDRLIKHNNLFELIPNTSL